MNTAVNVPTDWQQWISRCLASGMGVVAIADEMERKGFDRSTAVSAIEEINSRRINQLPRYDVDLPTELSGDWERWLSVNMDRGIAEQAVIEETANVVRKAYQRRMQAIREKSEKEGYTYEFTWPPVEGIVQTDDGAFPILYGSEKPHIVLLGNVFSKEECEAVIAMARSRLAPSVTIDNGTGLPAVSAVRRSKGTFLGRGETPLIERLERRLSDIARWPVTRGEGFHVLHYEHNDAYIPHYDFFPPELPGSVKMTERGGQRIGTLIAYLNTVEEGGETYFPKLDLTIKAEQGNVLYFSYTNSSNQLDRMTLHGGNPVRKGEKWIMTKWLRQRDY
ncbi:MAG TPA: 2OG-Fe(II) oxygenase [Noviherbaspirillum sp.]|nr:2OG-Fe(II) oxygenase [Noviherbaspirillum sp.]